MPSVLSPSRVRSLAPHTCSAHLLRTLAPLPHALAPSHCRDDQKAEKDSGNAGDSNNSGNSDNSDTDEATTRDGKVQGASPSASDLGRLVDLEFNIDPVDPVDPVDASAVEDVKMESGHLLIPYGRDDYQTLILEGDGRISPLAAIVDARAVVEERKGKERLMRATRVKQELKMAIQGTNGHGGCFFVAERREDGVVRPNEMNSFHCCVSSTKCRNCGV